MVCIMIHNLYIELNDPCKHMQRLDVQNIDLIEKFARRNEDCQELKFKSYKNFKLAMDESITHLHKY